MSVTFGGLVSGLDTDALISAEISSKSYRLNRFKEQQETYNAEKTAYQTMSTKYKAFQSALQTLLDGNIISSFDLFNKKDITSSNESAIKVTSNNLIQKGDYEISVNKLAEPPKTVLEDFAGYMTGKTLVTDLGITSGNISFSYYSDTSNPKTTQITVEITNGDTMDSLMTKINDAMAEATDGDGNSLGLSDVKCSITDDGRFSIDLGSHTTESSNFRLSGVGGSSSNFFDVMGITFDENVIPTEIVGDQKTWLNLSGKILDNSANLKFPVTSGGKINLAGVEIEIDEDTTVNDLINAVNKDSDSTATVSYDKVKNELVFTGKDTLCSDYIFFSGSALLSNYGVTDSAGVWDNSGGNHSKRVDGEIEIDGKKISVKSNVVTSSESGIEGLTLTLQKVTKEDEPVEVSITENTDALVEAIQKVVDAYNDMVTTLESYSTSDTETGEYGVLKGEYTLSRMQTELRSMLMGSVDSDDLEYKTPSLIGITSGAISTDATSTSSTLTFDKDAFLEAFNEHPDDVRALLIGDSDAGIQGIFEKLDERLDDYLDYEDGYFVMKTNSISQSITSLDKSISDEEERLEAIRERLQKQYANMETTLAELQSQSF